MSTFADDESVMRRALEIARNGTGLVEPNPAVGAVIVDADRRFIAEGFHERFGGPHAEINAIRSAGERCRGTDLFVTLEPCSHFGKTPPCVETVIDAGFRRVVVGCPDPAAHVNGRGITRIREAGVTVQVGICEAAAHRLIAPFEMLHCHQRPWVHAKWAMTLDGKIASSSGHSKWISCEESRRVVHELRGRMDAILTGAGTVRADDPLLTARPPGLRTPVRVVMSSDGTALSTNSQLVRTARDFPVLLFVSDESPSDSFHDLHDAGVEICAVSGDGDDDPKRSTARRSENRETQSNRRRVRPSDVLAELGRRRMTNVLLEAGGRLTGAFFDVSLVDELHVFVAPKIVGGEFAVSPVAGAGLDRISQRPNLINVASRSTGTDLYFTADVAR